MHFVVHTSHEEDILLVSTGLEIYVLTQKFYFPDRFSPKFQKQLEQKLLNWNLTRPAIYERHLHFPNFTR